MTTRRSFIASILAAGAAPAVARSSVLMPVRSLIVPEPMSLVDATWKPVAEFQNGRVAIFTESRIYTFDHFNGAVPFRNGDRITFEDSGRIERFFRMV